jgi:hypothetical protein
MLNDILPSQVRVRLLADHAALRQQIAKIRTSARTKKGSLVEEARALAEALRQHIDREDQLLLPTLRDIDAWGPERARRLSAWHLELRERIQALEQAFFAPHARAHVIAFVDQLEEDLAHEERAHLADEILRELPIRADLGGD